MENKLITLLRWALGLIFLWFGLLKLAGHNPVYELVNASVPFLASGQGLMILGGAEALLGLALIAKVFTRVACVVLILHLVGTFSPFFTAPTLMFQPQFPILTLAGEFVIKNLILMAAAGLILVHERKRLQ